MFSGFKLSNGFSKVFLPETASGHVVAHGHVAAHVLGLGALPAIPRLRAIVPVA